MALQGIDVSSFQSGLNVGTAPVDFVIIKATEGTGYVNPACDTHYQQAKNGGKLRGVYHFGANKGNSAQAEAQYFIDNVKGYVGDALLALDNENSNLHDEGNVGWALTWLQEVERLTGVKPLIYMNANCVNTHDWTSVINNGNALWVAAYQTNPPDVNWPNEKQAIWQYSSSFRVAGYNGNLDADTAWMTKTAWKAYAAPQAAPAPPPTTPPAPVTPPVVPTPVPSTPPAPEPVVPPTPSPVSVPVPSAPPVTPDSTLWDVISTLLGKIVEFLKSFKRNK